MDGVSLQPDSMKRTLGTRLRARRKELDMSMEDVADAIGIKYQTIQDLESGKSRGSKHVLAIARVLRVRPEWLESEQGAMEEDERGYNAGPPAIFSEGGIIDIGGAEFANLPVYDIRFAAGGGSVNPDDETPIDRFMIGLGFLRSLSDAPLSMIAVFQADGDSMEPTISSRDWVVVDRRRTKLGNPGIYALVFEEEGLLKRVDRHLESGAVTLISDNKSYATQTIKKPDRLMVVGRVILSIRRH